MRLDDPWGKRNTHRDFLPAIRVPIFLVIFPDGRVSKPATGLGQVECDRLLRTLYKPW